MATQRRTENKWKTTITNTKLQQELMEETPTLTGKARLNTDDHDGNTERQKLQKHLQNKTTQKTTNKLDKQKPESKLRTGNAHYKQVKTGPQKGCIYGKNDKYSNNNTTKTPHQDPPKPNNKCKRKNSNHEQPTRTYGQTRAATTNSKHKHRKSTHTHTHHQTTTARNTPAIV